VENTETDGDDHQQPEQAERNSTAEARCRYIAARLPPAGTASEHVLIDASVTLCPSRFKTSTLSFFSSATRD
jgi:hypothetical protein